MQAREDAAGYEDSQTAEGESSPRLATLVGWVTLARTGVHLVLALASLAFVLGTLHEGDFIRD